MYYIEYKKNLFSLIKASKHLYNVYDNKVGTVPLFLTELGNIV